jgi:hypothetical protein
MCDNELGYNAHDVILEMLADTFKVQQDGDTGSSQNIFWTNATVHQDIGASDGTGGQYDLLASVDGGDGAALDDAKLNTGCSHVAIEQNLGNRGINQDVKI